MIFFCLPETLRAKDLTSIPSPANTPQVNEKADNVMTRVSTTQSVQLKTKRIAVILKSCIIDPLSVLSYLRFPAVAIVVYWAAITFGSVSFFGPFYQSHNCKNKLAFSIIEYDLDT